MLACKCLNVIIETNGKDSGDFEKVNVESLRLGIESTSDAFFKQDLQLVQSLQKVTTKISGLVSTRCVGPYTVHLCFNCNLHTHAVHKEKGNPILISANLLRKAAIEAVEKNSDFSTNYNIMIDTNLKNLSNSIYSNMAPDEKVIVNNLMQRANESISRELAAVENKISQYSDQQYTLFEEYKARVLFEHDVLSRKILEGKRRASKENTVSTKTLSTPLGNRLSKNQVPETPESPNRLSLFDRTKQAFITSSPKPIISNRKLSSNQACSFDSEGLFQLEDMDEDLTYVDSEHEESEDDSTMNYSRNSDQNSRRQSLQMAKSLPVSIPALKAFKNHINEDNDDRMPEESMDIAASIKALAKSIQGDTIFGDLPARPRFSSQI
ncbi:uncharacterized protein [Onthophagus taurus]|uniref:uncharacterized protein n=1 Tax=Onthophagus taurus TaxID=166361 RepID=UPI000C201D1D|nr:uncharacterized protein LOC111416932 [Onthophagus taurus]